MEKTCWPEKITNHKLIVVEGKDDVGFFVRLLDEIGVRDYFVWGIEGKNNFNQDLPLIQKVSGFDDLKHLVVIRDNDIGNAFDSIKNILIQKMGFQNVPSKHGEIISGTPSVGVFIMPGRTVQGNMLEDLCLKIVEKHPAMKCVNEFISCVSALREKPKNISKAKVQAFLASQPEIANTIGLGASKNYWDFNSSILQELKDFLIELK